MTSIAYREARSLLARSILLSGVAVFDLPAGRTPDLAVSAVPHGRDSRDAGAPSRAADVAAVSVDRRARLATPRAWRSRCVACGDGHLSSCRPDPDCARSLITPPL
jgi:hypothetical protein